MSQDDRSQTGAKSEITRRRVKRELTFPAALVHPPRSQVVQYGDEISDRIAKLDAAAQQLGEGFGMSFTSFILNPLKQTSASDPAALVVLSTLQAFMHREERVSLERRSGRWGLYFARGAALIGQERASEAVPLREAPLDVRERFLDRSEQFFREYLQLCEDRFGRMKSSVSAGDQTIALLAKMRLE